MQPKLMIVSGGTGASASLVVNTILAQFPQAEVTVEINEHVRQESQIAAILERAAATQALVVHTLVQTDLRHQLIEGAAAKGLGQIDLVGPLIEDLGVRLAARPLERPGLYRLSHIEEIDRAAAVNFTINHDDGLHPEELNQAEIVILGVSRAGKTPLSMYLGVQGWRVANVPLIDRASLPAELNQLERGRLVGLLLSPEAVQAYRRQRQAQFRLPESYCALGRIFEELEEARQIYRELGASPLDITAKPVETCADEVVARVSARLGSNARQRRRPDP
jgi:hypothetical protein